MINLLISLALGAVAAVASYFVVGPLAAVLPFFGVFVGSFIFLFRRTNKQIEGSLMEVQKELRKGKPQNIEKGITMLEGVKAHFGPRQFFVKGGIDGQIGALYYAHNQKEKARPYLEGAMSRAWEAKAMLAVMHYRKKEMGRVDEIMEKSAKTNPKAGLLWSTWAWMHWKLNNNDKALSILARGKDMLGDKDQTLSSNLLALQNKKKMKMKPYGEQWYLLGLEQHPALRTAQRGGNVRFARR